MIVKFEFTNNWLVTLNKRRTINYDLKKAVRSQIQENSKTVRIGLKRIGNYNMPIDYDLFFGQD